MKDYLRYVYGRAPIEHKLAISAPFIAALASAPFDLWTALERFAVGLIVLGAYGCGVHAEIVRVREDYLDAAEQAEGQHEADPDYLSPSETGVHAGWCDRTCDCGANPA